MNIRQSNRKRWQVDKSKKSNHPSNISRNLALVILRSKYNWKIKSTNTLWKILAKREKLFNYFYSPLFFNNQNNIFTMQRSTCATTWAESMTTTIRGSSDHNSLLPSCAAHDFAVQRSQYEWTDIAETSGQFIWRPISSVGCALFEIGTLDPR